MTILTGTLSEEICTFFTTAHPILLRMGNVSDKSCTENQNTHFVFNNFFFFRKSAVYEIMWKNVAERGRPQMTIWRMRIACCITKATNTHRGCVILTVFPLNSEGTNRSGCFKYTACLVSD